MDALEPRLLLSAYVFDTQFTGTVGSGPPSAWGPENATDPNNSLVHYTNTTAANATQDNPVTMEIVNDAQSDDGQALAMTLEPAPNGTGDYVSSEIATQFDPSGAGNSLEYGEISARIRIPGGSNSNAIWPAFWLLGDNITSVGWPACGEIDVMENDGAHPTTIDSTLHGPASGGGDYNGGDGVGSSYTLPGGADYYSSYHIFSVNWGPNSITFSVDGDAFVTLTPASLPAGATWPFNGHPFYIILDVCEGGGFAPGTITSPQTMYVDWVHASAFNAAAAPALSDQDIGSPAKAGSGYFDGITNTVNGGGTGIGGTSDQFNFDSQLLSGNFTLVTSVDWIDDTAKYAKGGLMVRNGTGANAAYAFIQMEPYGGGPSGTGAAVFEYRSSAGASAITAGTDSSANLVNGPVTLELVRSGNAFTAYDSTNGGSTWNQIGSSVTIAMNSTVDVGLAATADAGSSLSTDTFTNLGILPGRFIDTNIGAPNRVGDAAATNNSSILNIGGGGAGITGTSDQFNFAGQSLTGSGSVIADVLSMTSTTSLAAAGIMFRNDTTAGAAFAMIAETTAGGLTFEWRPSAGASAQSVSLAAVNAPWIELLRTGNSFSAYYSSNDSQWTQIGSAETITIGSTALVGAAVTAGDNGGAINVATFSLLSVANAAATLIYMTPPADTTAGDPFPSTITVAVEDSSGNLVQSDDSNVTISVGSGSATLQGTLTATAKNGIATFSNLATASPGSATLLASDGNLSGATSSSITVANPPGISPAVGATYSITGYPGSETLDVSAGTLTLTQDLSTQFSNYALQVENGASVVLASDQHIGALQLVGSGSLDMSNYTMFINYGSNPDPISAIAGHIKSGYNGGAWNGTGIMSTAAQTPTNGLYYGLGYADGADGVVAGLSSGQIEVKYTLLGDANLDGLVNAADFNILAANFNQSITGWDQGDFNYDGLVNAADFNELAANFNQGASGASVASSAAVLPAPAISVVVSASPSVAAVTTESTAAAPIAPKSQPVSVSKAASGTKNWTPARPLSVHAAAVVTIPSAGSAATPQNINKDAKFLADR
ncbi:MAG: family 16 glycosylhydrolase [Tepidisphaeraceae bacterium]